MGTTNISQSRLSAILKEMGTSEPDAPVPSMTSVPAPTALVAPTTIVAPLQDEHTKRLNAFVRAPIKPLDHNRFKDSMRLVSGKISSINDWLDNSYGQRASYSLLYLEDSDIVKLGIEVFTSLKSDISLKAVANLLLLAYNLKDKDDLNLFSEVPASFIDYKDLEEFEFIEDKHLKTVQADNLAILISETDADYLEKVATGFSYLACSYLRLYTKSAENYTKIEAHLKNRFENFYQYPLPFDSFHPELDAVLTVKSTLELTSRLKNTFYNFLYAGELNPEGRNIKDFLYALHVSYTGLHPFTLFNRCMAAMKVTNQYLATIMYSPTMDQELTALAHVYSALIDTGVAGRECQMWKYARIFDPRFLSTLQTKNCRFFTLVLANLLHMVAKESYMDVKRIAQIENMSDQVKLQAEGYAARAIKIWNYDQFGASNYSGLADL